MSGLELGKFLIWNPLKGPPTVPYKTEEEAKAQALNLSEKAPNTNFYILQAVSIVHTIKAVVPENIIKHLLNKGFSRVGTSVISYNDVTINIYTGECFFGNTKTKPITTDSAGMAISKLVFG